MNFAEKKKQQQHSDGCHGAHAPNCEFVTLKVSHNNNNDFINVSSKNLAEGIPHC